MNTVPLDDCEYCKAYEIASKDAGTPPVNVAEFFIMFGEAMKTQTVTSSMSWIMFDLMRNVVRGRFKPACPTCGSPDHK